MELHHRTDGLPSDQIQSLAFDTPGTLYAGTQCDGFAIASGKDNYQRWKQIAGSDSVPLTPTGAGLPGNLINQVLVDRNGTVYVATTCGLAASKDGKRSSFVRSKDWAAKVKGLYGGRRAAGGKPKPISRSPKIIAPVYPKRFGIALGRPLADRL